MTWPRSLILLILHVLHTSAIAGCAPERDGPPAGRADVRDVSFTEIPSPDTAREPSPEEVAPTSPDAQDVADPDGPDLSDVDEVVDDLGPSERDGAASPTDLADAEPDVQVPDQVDAAEVTEDSALGDAGPDVTPTNTCGDGVCDPDEGCLTCADCPCPVRCGADILISEYLEGTSWNKALELANLTGAPVDLSTYALWKITNGGAWGESPAFPLSGTLAHGDTLVLCHALSLPALLARCDLTTDAALLEFNGDDALALVHDGDIIDLIGEDGADPGVGWSVSGVEDATAEHTLRRRADRLEGSADWSRESQTWEVLERDLVTGLGAHRFAATCAALPPVLCGDDACGDLETCASCVEDCGLCGPAPGELVITEIAPMGLAAWFEVTSVADAPRALDDLVVWGHGAEMAIALSPMAPGESRVLGGDATLVDAYMPGFELAAEADAISLEVRGVVIDRVDWSAPLVEGGTTEVWSLSPGHTAADNDAAELWCPAPVPGGSPGAPNAPCPRCGDAVCDALESCDLCPSDCGLCPVFACATDLFLSEYVEGSSNNKAVEVANFTGSEVDLSRYAIWKITNGSGTGWAGAKKVPLEGLLPHGETFVFCHSQASPLIFERCDLIAVSATVMAVDFNGDDAIGLARDGVLIDAVGEEGPDPGTAWPIGSEPLATVDHTLRRAAEVLGPEASWSIASTSWVVGATDDFSGLGQHAFGYICEP
jgi:hypothetical protein